MLKKAAQGVVIAVVSVTFFYAWQVARLYLSQDEQIYRPNAEWIALPDSSAISFEDAIFYTSDGLRLSGWLFDRPDSERIILVCHGNAGNISYWINDAADYAGIGFDVFLFDYRGYGKSEGKPSEKGLYEDARAAWRYLTVEKKYPDHAIIILGRSLGAAVAANLASEVTPAALVLESGFVSLKELAKDIYPRYPVEWLLGARYDTAGAVEKVRVPVLIVHSRDDTLISFKHAEKLYQAAPSPKQFIEIRGAHHEGYRASSGDYLVKLKAFLGP